MKDELSQDDLCITPKLQSLSAGPAKGNSTVAIGSIAYFERFFTVCTSGQSCSTGS